jgi:hypothetical protein
MHRKTEHNLPPLGNKHQMPAESLRGRQLCNIFAIEPDMAIGCGNKALEGAQQRRFAGAVGAKYRHQFIRAYSERDIFDRVSAAVAHLEMFDLK